MAWRPLRVHVEVIVTWAAARVILTYAVTPAQWKISQMALPPHDMVSIGLAYSFTVCMVD